MQNNHKGKIRIISGKYRSRILKVTDANGLRPTTDRVKEMLFNWLRYSIVGANCLDCFAGSGSLGFEALSNGAKYVKFLEKHQICFNLIKQNAKSLQVENYAINLSDTLSFLQDNRHNMRFDLIFIDPPFRKNLVAPTVDLLLKQNWLNAKALIYIEMAKDEIYEIPDNLVTVKQKITGQVLSLLLQYKEE